MKIRQFACIAIAFLWLLPCEKAYSREKSARENNTLRIMSYNVRNCNGLDKVVDFQRIADVINKACPDVVAVQELDSVTKRSKGRFVLRDLAE